MRLSMETALEVAGVLMLLKRWGAALAPE